MRPSAGLSRILQFLRRNGLLLESDAVLPSVVSLVVGEPVGGSWWGHERGNEIYGLTQELAAHPDVLCTKLVSGKVTYVHRRLWAPLASIAFCRGRWQTRDLSVTARALLRLVRNRGELMTNEVPRDDPRFGKRIGEGVRELERRLLVVTKEVHTATGAHSKLVCSWERWLKQAGPLETGWDCHSAKQEFERIVVGLNRKHGVNARLPWS